MIASRSLKEKVDNFTVATIRTSQGEIKIELNADKAPNTVKNFISYAREKQYDNTIFHRVISNFMIQGGEFKSDKEAKKPSRDPIKSEAHNGLKNQRGAMSMARTGDPDSAKAQFFINVRNNEFLNNSKSNAGYTVFGKVIKGMNVVDEIKNGKTKKNDWPEQPVIIEEIILSRE